MEDNYQVQDTEVEIERDESENKGPSIREALTQHLEQSGQTETEVKAESEPQQEVNNEVQTVHSVNRPVLLPPADMRAEEKDAFLNPTPDNAHILQNYLNRRAYETRSDYSRKMTEVEDLKRRTSGLYDSIKEYEQVYARQGVSLGDIAKRSIAWDQAMQKAPVQTALEWLESYGLTLEELTNQTPENQNYEPQTQSRYLTKEEAERIAEERIEAVMKQQEQKAVELFNQRVVESFMNTKPVFRDPETASQIESEMAPIVSALTGTGRYNSPEEILETAYNYVINGNPVYSSLVRQMTAKPMIEQKQAVAQQAKAASRSISGSPGSGTPRLEVKDLRENLRRRFIGDD
jgi:hypothetical protein